MKISFSPLDTDWRVRVRVCVCARACFVSDGVCTNRKSKLFCVRLRSTHTHAHRTPTHGILSVYLGIASDIFRRTRHSFSASEMPITMKFILSLCNRPHISRTHTSPHTHARIIHFRKRIKQTKLEKEISRKIPAPHPTTEPHISSSSSDSLPARSLARPVVCSFVRFAIGLVLFLSV